MKYLLAMLVGCLAASAQTPTHTPPIKVGPPTISSTAQPESVAGSPETGATTLGQTYRNSYFRFSYEAPANWTYLGPEALQAIREDTRRKTEDLLGGTSQADHGQFTHTRHRKLGATGESILISAEDVGRYPEVKTSAEYLSAMFDNMGYEAIGGLERVTLGGRIFSRQKTRQKAAGGYVFHSITTTLIGHFALSFDCVGVSDEKLSEVLKTLQSIKFEAVAATKKNVPAK